MGPHYLKVKLGWDSAIQRARYGIVHLRRQLLCDSSIRKGKVRDGEIAKDTDTKTHNINVDGDERTEYIRNSKNLITAARSGCKIFWQPVSQNFNIYIQIIKGIMLRDFYLQFS
jgi:hypothetical protein